MNIQNTENSPKVPFDLEAFVLHAEERVELVHLTLQPHEKLAQHNNPYDVVFFVIEGKGILSVDGQNYNLKAGDTTKITSDNNRGWINNTEQDLKLLVIKLL